MYEAEYESELFSVFENIENWTLYDHNQNQFFLSLGGSAITLF